MKVTSTKINIIYSCKLNFVFKLCEKTNCKNIFTRFLKNLSCWYSPVDTYITTWFVKQTKSDLVDLKSALLSLWEFEEFNELVDIAPTRETRKLSVDCIREKCCNQLSVRKGHENQCFAKIAERQRSHKIKFINVFNQRHQHGLEKKSPAETVGKRLNFYCFQWPENKLLL